MRRVKLSGSPPQDWVIEATAITDQMRRAKSGDERKAIIEKHEGLWRDDRIRNWLLNCCNNQLRIQFCLA